MPAAFVPPPDWVTGPPDFIGVGAQKAGTSWWFEMIATHPRVTRPHEKELHFFDGFWERPFGDSDVAAYHAMFPRPTGGLAGEWTPRYMHDFWVPPLLARAAPAAKLLVLLRDPVERYRSGLAFTFEWGAPALPHVATDAYFRGLYAHQLARLFDYFDRRQVLVLQHERCEKDPETELRRTWQFLELEEAPLPDDLHAPVNPTTVDKPALPPGIEDALRTAYKSDIEALARLVPDLDVGLWRSAQ